MNVCGNMILFHSHSTLANNMRIRLSSEIIEKICSALDCQPGDIMEYLPDAAGTEKGGGRSEH